MNAFLLKQWDDIRSSYWFVPTIMVIIAIALSFFTNWADTKLGSDWIRNLSFLFENKTVGARAVLSAIAGSMITVAGVIFSMTIVAVSYASSQFGPRLIGNFLRDRGNQLTLGVFVATFVYCLMTLRTVRDGSSADGAIEAFVPHLSILVALGLALTCVGFLVYFFHHVPESINIGNLIAKVAIDLQVEIKSMFPDDMGDALRNADRDQARKLRQDSLALIDSQGGTVCSNHDGYLRALDEKTLLQYASEHDLVIRLACRPGAFVSYRDALLRVYPTQAVDASVNEKLLSCFAFGRERTATQDCMFLVDQLVEIIGRAMSPGVNDPFTAIACLNWLQPVLIDFGSSPTPDPYRVDEEQNLRIIVSAISFEEFCDAIFNRTLQYVAGDRNTALCVLNVLESVGSKLRSNENRRILIGYANNLLSASNETIKIKCDRDAVNQRYESVLLELNSQ